MIMDTISENTVKHPRWAQAVSDVFSPLLIPTYGMILAMWVTPMRSIPESNRIVWTILIAFLTGAVPFAALVSLMKAKKISDHSLSDRNERIVPMSITTGCYIAAGFFLGWLGAPLWLRMFFFGAAIATAAAMAITLRWKISAHTTAFGGLAGMMTWCSLAGIADVSVMLLLSAIYLLCGLVGTTRLILDRHSVMQVAAGAALGFIICFASMFI